MIGVSEDLSKQMEVPFWVAAFDAPGASLDLRGTYQRRNGDASVLPLRSHLKWIASDKRLTLVALEGGVEAARQKIATYLSAEAPRAHGKEAGHTQAEGAGNGLRE